MIIILFITLYCNKVYAENATFYEAEYINGIYMNKYDPRTQTTFYQKARFFRKKTTEDFAYCIEPFVYFYPKTQYYSTTTPNNLSIEQINRISKIAHFGYGYINHEDQKWYAITQLMIWKESDPIGDYYFTDSLNGNRISIYENEINEINYLVNNWEAKPSLSNKVFNLVENEKLQITDDLLNNYKSNYNNLTINNNYLETTPLSEGEYNFILTKQNAIYNRPYIFFQGEGSQNLIRTGDIEDINVNFKVIVKKTEINIQKIDQDTNSIESQGQAELNNSIFNLLDSNKNIINEIKIENNTANISNINYGTYYLQEKEPGLGYKLNTNLYEIKITVDNPTITILIPNKVIEKKIIIEKKYGENNDFQNEKDITFNLYNYKNELIDKYTTNELGIIELILPYGNYQLIQENTTEGYQKIDPLKIIVEDEEDEIIELKDYKIPVPDTHTNSYLNIILFIISLIC